MEAQVRYERTYECARLEHQVVPKYRVRFLRPGSCTVSICIMYNPNEDLQYLLCQPKGIASGRYVLLFDELDLRLGGIDVFLFLFLCRQLAIAIGSVSTRRLIRRARGTITSAGTVAISPAGPVGT
jgi:hypothetical protein